MNDFTSDMGEEIDAQHTGTKELNLETYDCNLFETPLDLISTLDEVTLCNHKTQSTGFTAQNSTIIGFSKSTIL